MKMSKGIREGIALVAGLSILGGCLWYIVKPDSRDRVFRYLKYAEKEVYETNVGNCKVTVKRERDYFVPDKLCLIIENEQNPELKKLELEDYSDTYDFKRFTGLDYITIDGKRINADDISKETLRHYEKVMDEKLAAIEPRLKELAAKLKPQHEKQEKEAKIARKERATKLAEQYKNSLPDMCSE